MALVPDYDCFAARFVPRNDFVTGSQDKQLALPVDLGHERPVINMKLEPIATVCQYRSTFGSMPVRSEKLDPFAPFNNKLAALIDRHGCYGAANSVGNLSIWMAKSR
jgi:hypothetical protein